LLAFWCNASSALPKTDEMRSECGVAAIMLRSLARLRELERRRSLPQVKVADRTDDGGAITFATASAQLANAEQRRRLPRSWRRRAAEIA
jgi:hypothetical protein